MDQIRSRELARQMVKQTVSDALWRENTACTDELRQMITAHRLMQHPFLKVLSAGGINEAGVKLFHRESYYGFAQIFTDSIVTAMQTATQLEPTHGPMGKITARFLLQLNLLDELGFVPGVDVSGEYQGDPRRSHYAEFNVVLQQLGISYEEIIAYRPSPATLAVRASYEDTYGDYLLTIGLLAAAESAFSAFAGPWARSVAQATSIDVSKGYHSIHVAGEDGTFIDDDHSEDSWYLVCQALTADRRAELRQKTRQWLNTWAAFADYLMMACTTAKEAPSLRTAELSAM